MIYVCESCKWGYQEKGCNKARREAGVDDSSCGSDNEFFEPIEGTPDLVITHEDVRTEEDSMKCTTCRYDYPNCYDVIGPCSGVGKWEAVPGAQVYGDGEETVDGLKYDVHKTDMTFLADWGLALEEICKLSAFGAKKYERGGWTKITKPERLYACMLRHYFKAKEGEPDEDSGMMHDVAVAWNALSALQVRLQNDKQ